MVGSHPTGRPAISTVSSYRKRSLVIGGDFRAGVESVRGPMAYKVFFSAIPENRRSAAI
jgi:hypothetical protein